MIARDTAEVPLFLSSVIASIRSRDSGTRYFWDAHILPCFVFSRLVKPEDSVMSCMGLLVGLFGLLDVGNMI